MPKLAIMRPRNLAFRSRLQIIRNFATAWLGNSASDR
jgi:hypothetical protein